MSCFLIGKFSYQFAIVYSICWMVGCLPSCLLAFLLTLLTLVRFCLINITSQNDKQLHVTTKTTIKATTITASVWLCCCHLYCDVFYFLSFMSFSYVISCAPNFEDFYLLKKKKQNLCHESNFCKLKLFLLYYICS